MTDKELLPILRSIGEESAKHGLKAWVVGGAVRDGYLKRKTKDIDISFDGEYGPAADFVLKKWGGKKELFPAFGTARITLDNGFKIDFVRCRKEVYVKPAALPRVTAGTLKDDLFRRDFTANAWALSILPENFGESFDLFGAKDAIDGKYIKILHDKSFLDDPTRCFRAVRFAGRFGWEIEAGTAELLRRAASEKYPALLSRERLRQELIKILEEQETEKIFALMKEYGLLNFIYAGLEWTPLINKTKNAEKRLALLACAMAENGEEFIKSLRLPRELTQEISGAVSAAESQKSPLKEFTKNQKDILKIIFPDISSSALEPCFITGGELHALGVNNEKITLILDEIRRKQWSGEIKNKDSALALAKHLLNK